MGTEGLQFDPELNQCPMLRVLFGTRLGVDFIVRNLFLLDRRVQWSSGYDFCLTYSIHMGSYNTEGLQFDPGLNHFFVFPSHPKTVLHPNSDSLYYHKYDEKSRVCTMCIISTNDKRSKNTPLPTNHPPPPPPTIPSMVHFYGRGDIRTSLNDASETGV